MNIVAWGKLSCNVGNVRMMKLIAPSLPVLLKEQKLRRVQWKAWKQGIAQVNIVDSNCTTVPSFRDSRGVPAAVLWHGPLRPFIRRHVAGSVCERPAAHSVQQVEQWRGECLKSWALFFKKNFPIIFIFALENMHHIGENVWEHKRWRTNVFSFSSVFAGHVEADVRMLGPQSTITPHCSTSQENISQNGGIARHQNLSDVWTEFVSKASQRQDQALFSLTWAVRPNSTSMPSLLLPCLTSGKHTEPVFCFVFVFSFAFCESCTITGFEQIQTAYVNLLKVLGWTTDLSALHTKLLVSVSAVYAFVLFWSGMNLKFLPYGKTLVTFSQAQLFVMLDYTS